MRITGLAGIGAILLGCGGSAVNEAVPRGPATHGYEEGEQSNDAVTPAQPVEDGPAVPPEPVEGGGGSSDSALASLNGSSATTKAAGRVATPDDGAIKGALTKEEIRRVIKMNINRIRYCYEKQLVSEPKLAGKATTKFTIGGDGKIVSAEVQGFGSAPVDACIEAAIRAMVFPQPKGGGVVVVTYPFIFSSNDSVGDPADSGAAAEVKDE